MNETRAKKFFCKKNIACRDEAEKKHRNKVEIKVQMTTNLHVQYYTISTLFPCFLAPF